MKLALHLVLSMTAMIPLVASADDLHLDATNPRSRTLRVDDGTQVTVVVTKRPNQICKIDYKRAPLPPEPDPIAQLLEAAKPFTAAGEEDPFSCKGADGHPLPTDPPTGLDHPRTAEVESRIAELRTRLAELEKEILTAETAWTGGENLRELLTCKTSNDLLSKSCANESAYRKASEDILQAAQKFRNQRPVDPSALRDLLSRLDAAIDRARTDGPIADPAFDAWLSWSETWRRCLMDRLTDLSKRVNKLQAAREALDALEKHRAGTTQSFPLVADEDAKIDGTVACKSAFSTEPWGNPIPFSVTYRGERRFSISAGLLISPLDASKIKPEAVRTDDAAGFELRIAEVDRKREQVLPFSFLNWTLVRRGDLDRSVRLGLSTGFGLNDNTGSNRVEYFAGPTVSYGNVVLHIGAHRGYVLEPANGFAIGGVPPEKLPAVPTRHRSSTRFAIALSYRVLK